MKRSNIILTLLTILGVNSITSNAQELKESNQWSVGFNVGGHDAVFPSNTSIKFFTHLNGDVRYMVNNRFGVMGDIGYENFDWKTDDVTNNTHLTRLSLQGVANLADILRFDTWTNRFGLLMHGGAGITNMWQKGKYSFGEGDQMGNFILGITPQFSITDRIAVNLDWSGIALSRQDRRFDFKSRNNRDGINAFYMTASAGVSIALGKNKKHMDWIPTEFGGNNSSLEARLKQLEDQLKDDDNDGVINSRDAQANTPAGTIVNSKGEAINVPLDSDNDGITDAFDKCPNEKGSFSSNGCPDTDGDGVIDSEDTCPKTFGVRSNGGCPELDEETKKTFEQALHGINFETGKEVIKSSSHSILDNVVSILKTHDDYNIEIHGHTDNVGNEEENKALSANRAKAVKEYLTSKGIAESRITTFGHGQTQPVSTNETSEGRSDNRRVEFIVRFEK